MALLWISGYYVLAPFLHNLWVLHFNSTMILGVGTMNSLVQ